MKTALIIIDMQNDFVLSESPGCITGAMETIPKIVTVLDYARKNNYPIFHVVREYRADGSDIELTRASKFLSGTKCVIPGSYGCEIVKELAPLMGEYRIVKPRFSAFMGTELDFILRRLSVTKLLICGTQYPNCIRATAYDAISLDYHTTVITDATSAMNNDIAIANIRDMQNIGIQCMDFANLINEASLT